MARWIKQLTRENTLLDRSLRCLAYKRSVKEIGKARIAHSPIVGQGRVTSLYYDPVDYKKQQKIILQEFQGKNIERMSRAIVKFLEEGLLWTRQLRNKKLTREGLKSYLRQFNKHHAHARGAIVYGYWGEPLITQKLKKFLRGKIPVERLDRAISILSSPKIVSGKLRRLYHPSFKLERKKQRLIASLKLSPAQKELVEILSWFTFFYEVGERVASTLYDDLLAHLKKAVKNAKEYEELQWYDPESLKQYLAGKKLADREGERRKEFYILIFTGGKLKVISGPEAKRYDERHFAEKIPTAQTELKGTVACLGKVQGRVKIVITQGDQKKMREGDILVSTMTTPRLMTAVKKAAAIVTDEGGMTAHAAIVSREFNIPCIVGTKIATKIFKDGDMVEVDANKGIVRKI